MAQSTVMASSHPCRACAPLAVGRAGGAPALQTRPAWSYDLSASLDRPITL